MTNFQEHDKTKKTQLESDGDGAGGGGHKKTAVGTGDDDDWGGRVWKSRLNRLAAMHPKIVGLVVMAHDGSFLAITFASNKNAEAIGIATLGIRLNTELAVAKIGRDYLRQIMFKTSQGYVFMLNMDEGVIATVTEDEPGNSVAKLPESIISTVTA